MRKFNIVFPLALGAGGSYVKRHRPVASRFKFLLNFRVGERPRFPEYGTRLEDLEQATDELDVLVPLQLLALRTAALDFISDVTLVGVTVERKLIPNRRIEFSIVYTIPGGNVLEKANFEHDLRFAASVPV